MIRYYTVSGDLENGFDFEYTFNHYRQAKDKYDSINRGRWITYKSLTATDDREGEIILERD